MTKDKIYRITGALFIIASLLIIFLVPDISKVAAVALGFFVGAGFGLLTSGENSFSFWKAISRK